jgi:hypothetical protein
MTKTLRILVSTSVVTFLAAVAPAHAAIMQWNLSNVTGDSGAETVTGFFDYNSTTDMLTSFSIQASGPISQPSFSFGTVGNGTAVFQNVSGGVTTEVALVTPAAVPPFPCSTCDQIFAGTTPITLTPGFLESPPDQFDGSVINMSNDLAGTIILSGTLVPSGAPEPASIVLLAGALIGFGAIRCRRRIQA